MANVLQQSRKGRGYADFLEFPTGEVLRTRVNGPLSCSKRRGFKKEVEHIVPANGAFIRPVSLWGPLPSRGDCSPLGWILVPLVGCISLELIS
jgi:hypothetical protein